MTARQDVKGEGSISAEKKDSKKKHRESRGRVGASGEPTKLHDTSAQVTKIFSVTVVDFVNNTNDCRLDMPPEFVPELFVAILVDWTKLGTQADFGLANSVRVSGGRKPS